MYGRKKIAKFRWHCICVWSLVLYVYTPVSGVPIVRRKLLHEQLRTHKVITKDEIVTISSVVVEPTVLL